MTTTPRTDRRNPPDRARPAAIGRRGLTLLEVILALSISAVVLAMVGSAVRLHMRMLDTQRMDVEQAELARELFRQITLDLQSAAAADPDSGQLMLDATADTSSGSQQGESTADEPAATSIDPTQQTAVGLYGTMTELRFDCSRARHQPLSSDPAQAERMAFGVAPHSELQTIAYYLGTDSQAASGSGPQPGGVAARSPSAAGAPDSSAARGTGLLRKRMDHAQYTHQVVSGSGASLFEGAALLAEEVVLLTFRYFDGMQWLDQWDSTAQQGLPVAVEVTLVIDSRPEDERDTSMAAQMTSFSQLAAGGDEQMVFQRVIGLPVAQPTWEVEAAY